MGIVTDIQDAIATLEDGGLEVREIRVFGGESWQRFLTDDGNIAQLSQIQRRGERWYFSNIPLSLHSAEESEDEFQLIWGSVELSADIFTYRKGRPEMSDQDIHNEIYDQLAQRTVDLGRFPSSIRMLTDDWIAYARHTQSNDDQFPRDGVDRSTHPRGRGLAINGVIVITVDDPANF